MYDLFRICYIQEKINKHFVLLKKEPFSKYLLHFLYIIKATVKCCDSDTTRKWGRKDRREIKPGPSRNDTEEQCNAIKTNYCQLVWEYWDFSDNWASFGMQLFTFCTFFFFLQWQGWERASGHFHTCGSEYNMMHCGLLVSVNFVFPTDLIQLRWDVLTWCHMDWRILFVSFIISTTWTKEGKSKLS